MSTNELKDKIAKYSKSMTMTELLILIIGEQGAKSISTFLYSSNVRSDVDSALDILKRMSIAELASFKGIGKTKASQLFAVIEFSRRIHGNEIGEVTKITCSSDAYKAMKHDLSDLGHEEFWVLLLNRSNHIIQKVKISQGGVSGTIADPKIIFNAALAIKASAMILVHNHPSGNKQPSQADIQLTKKIKKGGEILEVSVLDHIIFTDRAFYSFNDEGII